MAVAFPVGADGKVSTTLFAKGVWGAALRAAGAAGEADAAVAEKRWRQDYGTHVTALTRASLEGGAAAAVAAARAGLNAVAETMRMGDKSVAEAMAAGAGHGGALGTGRHAGSGEVAPLAVPVGGKELCGEDLAAQADAWASGGQMEPDAAAALRAVATGSAGGSLDGFVFVALGGTSELCPVIPLLKMGATVAAVSRPNPAKLATLVEAASKTAGTLLVPVPAGKEGEPLASVGGADVLTQAPEIAAWLKGLEPGKRLVVGSYIYLDGEAHVRASAAMDAIVADVLKGRPGTALAYIGTPSIVYPVPTAAAEEAELRATSNGLWWYPLASAILGPFEPAAGKKHKVKDRETGKEYCVFPGLSVTQGPNYALAKTMQAWRAVAAPEDHPGTLVSSRMAPVCRTESVTHVKAVARALRGMPSFPPTKVYDAPVVSPVLAGLLVYDLTKATEAEGLHPMERLAERGFHGGMWRCPYTFQSVSKAAYIIGAMS